MKWWKILAVVVVLGLAGWVYIGRKQVIVEKGTEITSKTKEKKLIKLAIVADIHNDWEEYLRAAEAIKKNGNDLLLVAGDMTIYGKKEELLVAKKELGESGMKYAVVPGNHDAYRSERGKNIYDGVFERRYQVIKIDNLKLILIDNSSYRGLGLIQWGWIENETAECRRLICIAVMHMPLNHNFSTHLMGENNVNVTAEAGKLLKLLVNTGVRRIEAGHLHYASSYELDGMRTDIVGAISRERNTQSPRYTELVIRGNEIERKVVEVEK
jgi:predicted phosphodiesterase